MPSGLSWGGGHRLWPWRSLLRGTRSRISTGSLTTANRYELLDGVLLVTPAPALIHQRVASRLQFRLTAAVEAPGLAHDGLVVSIDLGEVFAGLG